MVGVRAEVIYGVFTQKDAVMTLYFDNQREARGGYELAVRARTEEFLEHAHGVVTVILDPSMKAARPTVTQQWFEEFESLVNFEHMEYLNTTKLTNASKMFSGCMNLTSLDLSGFKTPTLYNASMMFSGCSSLEKLDLRSLDFSKMTMCGNMFDGCENLTTILSAQDWSQNVSEAYGENMFRDCTSLVGENGTHYSASHTGIEYARPDKPGQPGYFTITGQGIESIQPSAVSSQKTIQNGQLLIERNGNIYNAIGVEIK